MNQRFGWFMLGKQVSDYCNTSYFDVMERSALEISGLTLLMKAEVEFQKIK